MTPRVLSPAVSMVAVLALVLAGLGGLAPGSSAASKPKPYKVKIKAPATAAVGAPVAITGSVKPKAPKKKVKLQEQVAGKWRTIAQAKLDKKSKYSFHYTFTADGDHAWRVMKGAGDGHSKGVSKTATIAVMGSPGGHGAKLAVGRYTSCAVVGTGSVKCWGNNTDGQLGTGVPPDNDTHPTPGTVVGITDATAVGVGSGTSCAVVGAFGYVKCWGDNFYGELGSGATGPDSGTPVQVPGVSNAVSVDVGSEHVCALLGSGSVTCWGKNFVRVLGNPAVAVDAFSGPTPVSGVTTATAIDVGVTVSCALLTNHTITCWGGNDAGQLGDGTEDPRTTPQSVPGISDASAVSAGSFHVCALVSGGAVKCWGYNLGGGTGSPSPPDEVHSPALVPGVSGATAVMAGEYHSCAVVAAGAVTCWGSNDHGQMGTGGGALTPNQPPSGVSGLAGAVSAGGGSQHTCALLGGGAVQCWGGNFYGQLGNGDASHGLSNVPVAVLGVP